jgi:CRISPR-associated protein Cmr2
MTALQISEKPKTQATQDAKYTVVSFAPVQGFIEKSRKLRDLDGASKILSYLSWKIVKRAEDSGLRVISPANNDVAGNANIIQGMPNRILIQGDFLQGYVNSALAEGWKEIVTECHNWLTENLQISEVGWISSWTRWKNHAWELFCGTGKTIDEAMRDLETRKLRRDWIVPNWNGESSSLSGYDAIAHPNMDSLGTNEAEIKSFYKRLAEVLDPSGDENDRAYINENERLSIPELIKRLVTYGAIARNIHRDLYAPTFREVLRKDDKSGATYWTGWFMGDGDKVGEHLKKLTDKASVTQFSQSLRSWGKQFQTDFDQKGRVVYAGGDDFLGVMYGDKQTPKLDSRAVIEWLQDLRDSWEQGKLGITLSVGFVWAGHSVPQRDVLQHCRDAEKLAKKLGRDRVTIRVLFNNGQFVQWTAPWKYLAWLADYRDRNDNTGKDANWSHVYTDLAQLKARHAIPPATAETANDAIALELFGLYFGKDKQERLSQQRGKITGAEDPKSMIEWIDGMIKVGWQLCSNS